MGFRQVRKSISLALVGSPLPTSAAHQECLPNPQAMAVLSSDALSSVAYATDQTLAVLILAGTAALSWSLPITLAVIALVAIVVLSYQQKCMPTQKAAVVTSWPAPTSASPRVWWGQQRC
ncbi:hypothetical protein [Synechococcus sp. CBW1108]|uniref:hypothetical protein n=1 Tax=Synechococcus sp. CBW1108 TaxID=1353147 RepID=UPI001E2AF3C0|nr:hypothetical protein [Synechococcus sp. CBW1108]